MKPLYEGVVRHLRSQKGTEKALKLWDDLWNSFEKGGVETLASNLDERYVLPDDPEDSDEDIAGDDGDEETR
jgi:hypothetical protein